MHKFEPLWVSDATLNNISINSETKIRSIYISSNLVEGRTKIWQLQNLFLTLFGLIFRRIYIYILKNWSQFFFGSWKNKLKNVVHTV